VEKHIFFWNIRNLGDAQQKVFHGGYKVGSFEHSTSARSSSWVPKFVEQKNEVWIRAEEARKAFLKPTPKKIQDLHPMKSLGRQFSKGKIFDTLTIGLRETSKKLMSRARKVAPAGVNSPVRAWNAVGGDPLVLVRGRGAEVYDADGNGYVDMVCAWGPLIAGHAHPDVVNAVLHVAKRGTGFGAPTPPEIELGERIVEAFPAIEKVRLVTSGTEATMTAIRLARGATGRDRIVKMNGCYHGHSDGLLVKAGSGAATLGVPDSAGVPEPIGGLTSVVPYNDLEALRGSLAEENPVAAVIIEPIAANMGVVPPVPGYLEGVIEATHAAGGLVIFDEVITGLRVARGGAQELYGLQPDLTALGKVIGGGLPLAAVGGRADLMDYLAPDGPVYQAGTLSGNPVASTSGKETMKLLTPEAYDRLEKTGAQLEAGLRERMQAAGVPGCIQRVGSLLTLFFGVSEVRNFEQAQQNDTEAFARFFRAMSAAGINLPPSSFEAWFVSLAHGEAEVERVLDAAEASFGS
jgi:glutamate-1-semialdehyde 2,1-aminomutase